MVDELYDVVVVGGGNAALCAAISARDAGATVLVLESAPRAERGGNSAFTGGGMRVAYDGPEQIKALCPDLTDEQIAITDFGSYPEAAFYDDLCRVTEYRTDPDLADLVVSRSFETLQWMRAHGVRFTPIYGRQAYQIDGKFTFWGGLTVETWGGGQGLVDALYATAEKCGIEIWYESPARDLVLDAAAVVGVRAQHQGSIVEVAAGAVVLGSGGFEANPEWRARYLGPGWDLAKVRGSRFNMGDGIRMALDAGAMPWGHWSGAHAVGWERNAPAFGDLSVGDSFQKHSYPLGIMVNADGERFVDEGADFRNYTYAKYGSRILAQPQQFAWQVFDQKVLHLLRDEYRIRQVTKVTAGSLDELAKKLDGVDPDGFLATVADYNAAVTDDVPFDPNVKDGRRTRGLVINKSNWANRLDTPPFEAYAVTCGITFTFGGVRINTDAEVISVGGAPIAGLYACGELVGGVFFHNYPGGSGLTLGAVTGTIAGASAAACSAS